MLNMLPYDWAILLLGIYPRDENICSHKNLYANISNSTIHNSQKVETTQIFINWWVNEQNVVYPYNKIFSSVQFSLSVMSNSLRSHELQHARRPRPSPTPRVHPNPSPLCRWCHPTISSPVSPSPPTLNLSQHQGLYYLAIKRMKYFHGIMFLM